MCILEILKNWSRRREATGRDIELNLHHGGQWVLIRDKLDSFHWQSKEDLDSVISPWGAMIMPT